MGKQPQQDSAWQFWKKRNEEEMISSKSVMSCKKRTKEREELLRRLEDEKKKSKTGKKIKKLQEDCVRMMTRLVEDWGSEKCQEEEETFKRLEEAKL